jgi:hypothetical protein
VWTCLGRVLPRSGIFPCGRSFSSSSDDEREGGVYGSWAGLACSMRHRATGTGGCGSLGSPDLWSVRGFCTGGDLVLGLSVMAAPSLSSFDDFTSGVPGAGESVADCPVRLSEESLEGEFELDSSFLIALRFEFGFLLVQGERLGRLGQRDRFCVLCGPNPDCLAAANACDRADTTGPVGFTDCDAVSGEPFELPGICSANLFSALFAR